MMLRHPIWNSFAQFLFFFFLFRPSAVDLFIYLFTSAGRKEKKRTFLSVVKVFTCLFLYVQEILGSRDRVQ